MSNCYIVGSERSGRGLVIDPGAEAGRIVGAVEATGLGIQLIVATHGHIDHVGAVEPVRRALGAPFAMHPLENRSGGPYSRVPPPDVPLRGGEVIDLGDLAFEVRHLPGHSPGGIVLVGDGVVFSGDTLFELGIGRTDFPGGSYEELMEGIFTHLLSLPDDTVVYSGHGPETTIGAERRMNPFVRDWARRRGGP